ncbi:MULTISPECIES: hypothetical protein [Amycolatopsis]|uniref:hypothetical protein n=1 Tax=Amycolatopsis TaxID=1813 RepID=UPI000B8AF056|nr:MULTISPECIES: hypothetical protein [Amycolatopsis]OXM62272.1 hypothetical protein CF166_33050 [Amycolatopsis sp. KNN50.9b]
MFHDDRIPFQRGNGRAGAAPRRRWWRVLGGVVAEALACAGAAMTGFVLPADPPFPEAADPAGRRTR